MRQGTKQGGAVARPARRAETRIGGHSAWRGRRIARRSGRSPTRCLAVALVAIPMLVGLAATKGTARVPSRERLPTRSGVELADIPGRNESTPAPIAWLPMRKAGLDPCLCGLESTEVDALEARILDASTLDEARLIATRDTQLAYRVLKRARVLAPSAASLRAAAARLDDYHGIVGRASSRAEIATSFHHLTSPRTAADCDYSTGEMIAIVLGFILGIIPGLILLVLLC